MKQKKFISKILKMGSSTYILVPKTFADFANFKENFVYEVEITPLVEDKTFIKNE